MDGGISASVATPSPFAARVSAQVLACPPLTAPLPPHNRSDLDQSNAYTMRSLQTG